MLIDNIFNKNFSKELVINLVCFLFLFITIFPLSNKINFYQNDDYVYYSMTKNFMEGNFILDSYTSASFYTQGFIGAVFAKIFGLEKLPILTLIISILNFLILRKVLKRFFNFREVSSILVSLLFFLNPLSFYSIFGYMTENYFTFFLLLSIFFYLEFLSKLSEFKKNSGEVRKKNKIKTLLGFTLYNVLIILSFLLRQFGIITSISITFDLILKKNFRWAVGQGIVTLFLIFIQLFILPKTPAMYESSSGNFLEFQNLIDFKYLIHNLWGVGILISSIIFPLIWMLVFQEKNNKFLVQKILVTAIIFWIGLKVSFNPLWFEIDQFPYFGNVFERSGFFARDIEGIKYDYLGMGKIFDFLEILGQTGFCLFLGVIFWRLKKFLNFFSLYIVFFLGLFLVTPVVYDRYLLSVILIGILFVATALSKETFESAVAIPLTFFLIFLWFLNYQFSNDFIRTQKIIWEESLKITKLENIKYNQIDSTNAWRKTYGRSIPVLYKFSYDGGLPEFKYKVYKEYEVNYWMNFHNNPKIYLYKVL
jgi:hypothetical protein